MTIDDYRGFPRDAWAISLPSNRKGATSDYMTAAVPLERFAFVGNAGIVLDAKYLVVDFDREDPLRAKWVDALPPTWTQATPHGEHRLYRVPDEWVGHNRKIVSDVGSKPIIGDVKVHGYIVGPGSRYEICPNHPEGCARERSVYELVDDRDPVEAPTWLLEFAGAPHDYLALASGGADAPGIPAGSHDDFLHKYGSWLRGRFGLSEDAIATGLRGAVRGGLLADMDPGRPYTEGDIARLARSAARYPGGVDSTVRATSFICGADIDLIGPPIQWWIRGFVPRGELVMLYGPGGIGKSSWGSHLAAQVTKRGGTFAFVGVEESFAKFLLRATIGGADRAKVYSVADASRVMLPGAIRDLRGEVETLGAGVLYFDSIYSHFEPVPGLNTAERARRCLGPLAELAMATGCTVVGVFHTNKVGDYLGSVEMVNVARHVLRAGRSKGSDILAVSVDKTNLWEAPPKAYKAPEWPCFDPLTEQTQYELTDEGEKIPMVIRVLEETDEIPIDDIKGPADDEAPPP